MQTSEGKGQSGTRSNGWVAPLLAGMGLAAAGLAGAGVWAYRARSGPASGARRLLVHDRRLHDRGALAARLSSDVPSRPAGRRGSAGSAAPGAAPATLRGESGPLAGQVFSVTGSPYSIGRSADNNLVVLDTPVSRRHAQLELRDNRWYLRDLDSSNGTFLNRQPVIGAQPLTSGDLIALGDTVLVFTTQTAPGGGAVARPLRPMAGALVRTSRPASGERPKRWVVAAIVAVILILLVLAAVLLAGGLSGQESESTPGGPGITIPGLPSGLPALPTDLPELPTGLPTGLPEMSTALPVPTGLTLPTGLPKLP